MDLVADHFLNVLAVLGWVVAVLLCIAGIALSLFSISGTWLVLCAGALLHVVTPQGFPGWLLLGAYLACCILVEVVEGLSSMWGVQRRGGSTLTGWAALAGGIAGMVLGGWIPPPVLGSLLGMFLGSFLLAYVVERKRWKAAMPAATIAWGAVTARILSLMIKITATLGMVGGLAAGLLMH